MISGARLWIGKLCLFDLHRFNELLKKGVQMNATEAMNKLAALTIGLAAILLLGIVARDVLE